MAPGFAYADMVIDKTIVDIKAIRNPEMKMKRNLDQVLSYALLDILDVFELRQLAVYMGWQAVTLQVDIDEVLERGADGKPPELATMRQRIQTALSADLDGSEKQYYRRKYGLL
jgi:hypothetical protein